MRRSSGCIRRGVGGAGARQPGTPSPTPDAASRNEPMGRVVNAWASAFAAGMSVSGFAARSSRRRSRDGVRDGARDAGRPVVPDVGSVARWSRHPWGGGRARRAALVRHRLRRAQDHRAPRCEVPMSTPTPTVKPCGGDGTRPVHVRALDARRFRTSRPEVDAAVSCSEWAGPLYRRGRRTIWRFA